jgi:CRISPR-associated protein Cmr6
MSSRREILTELQPTASTHAGVWLETALPEVAGKDSFKQDHILEILKNVRISGDYPRFFARWRSSLEGMADTRTTEARVSGRMVVGLGAEAILETSISLHRTYGVPYIPGSALKGLAAAAAHKRLEHEEWRKVKADGAMGESHRILFGDHESGGYVTFHDALWLPEGDKLPLDLDVMTVHHAEYYQSGGVPPADWDNPNPVPFLTARGKYLLAVTGPEEWTEAALDILREALKQDGIGAKTAAGYGRMSLPEGPKVEKVIWEPLVASLNFGNAADVVPRILGQLKGAERLKVAQAMVQRLGQKEVRKRQEKEWAKMLLEAAPART